MNELTVFGTLLVFRVILPLGLLLLIGEFSRSRRQSTIKGL